MVVINNGELGHHKLDLDSLLDTTSDGNFSSFSNCDSRGMLKLNQELTVNKGNLYDFYRMDKGAPFATGLYAQVKRCRSIRPHPNSYYAAKFSPRKRPGQAQDEECVENLHEIALLSQLQNPYIICFEDAFILEDYVVTIMEFAPGGDLQSVIDADLVLLEKDASRYIYQLLEALNYLHEKHIAHLDIKPQNLLLMGEFPSCDIKLCDFEISRVIKPGKEVKEILGTPDYVAPEILLYEPLSTAADMWSVGILCYVLLTGFSPFGGDTDQETFRNIIHEPIDFPDELFEDVSLDAIDFILKVAVKNAKSRPTSIEMEQHEWVKSFFPISVPATQPAIVQPNISDIFVVRRGPKKRSPRKTTALSGSSTASATGRRPSARSILRACKSAYDLSKMGGKTKSREALVEKMKLASGEPSGGNWKLRKNLSKSREQLWQSKIQLSKSCEKINYNLPGSTRWASVANFPSLDLGAMKSSTSQESVISVMSTCTNIGASAQQQELLDWQQQSIDDFMCPTPHSYSMSMPNTPPIPNFDLSSPVNNMNMIHEPTAPGMNFNNCTTHPVSDFNYPSLVNGTHSLDTTNDTSSSAAAAHALAVEQESQKSVAELIMTFGGRVSANAKKLDLKNQFEPILEGDGNEENQVSLGDCSDNNSTSGVSSIIASSTATTPTTKESKSVAELKNESGNYSMNSCSSNDPMAEYKQAKSDIEGSNSSRNSSRRNSKTSQQIRDDMRSKAVSKSNNTGNETPTTTRRGSISPPKTSESSGLKGILKKPSYQSPTISNNIYNNKFPNETLLTTPTIITTTTTVNLTPGPPSSRRGSIPGNCTRLYDTHTISSLAKVPKRSILKNSQNTETKYTRSSSIENNPNKKGSERSSSKSPENNSPTPTTDKDSPIPPPQPEIVSTTTSTLAPINTVTTTNREASSNSNNTTTNPNNRVGHKGKIIPKGFSPRERPSFILLHDNVKDKVEKRSTATKTKKTSTKTPTAQTKRQQITKSPESSFDEPVKVTAEINTTLTTFKNLNPPGSPTVEKKNNNKNLDKNSKFKSELNIEPAAVAIKIFPPDPAIIPKSSKAQSHSPEPNNNINTDNNSSSDTINDNSINPTLINNDNHQDIISPEDVRRKPRIDQPSVRKRGEKSTWGIVCTGSVGRAMERFETGTGKGKKLRRGSVPDF